jgi:asparagine synthase (glutamine-hydrolysing)
VRAAVRALAHRGPDDEGIEVIDPSSNGWTTVYGHRRLAILDLSSAGHQPMRNSRNGDWTTYNGEVFNFHDVRKQLEVDGYSFHTGSDTEVLLAGLEHRALEALHDWRGMFALAWFDAQRKRTVLVRDRLGIKPLYYYFDGENFVFASELRALIATGLVPKRLSRVAIESYLAFGSIEQPLTILEGVYSVLPGHTLTFEDGRITSDAYWEVKPTTSRAGEGDFTDEITQLLREAVRLRLVSDVPVGVFLSGGIDSSAVVSLLRRANAGEIDSFSVCFQEEEFSESEHATRIANQFGTRHHTVMLTVDEVLKKLPRALAAMDQPSIDGINSWVVSEAAATSGLKVAISGLGGDEVFAGYSFFKTIARDERRRKQAQRFPYGIRSTAAAAVSIVSGGNRATKLQGLLRSSDLDEPAVRLRRRLFTTEQTASILLDEAPSQQEERDREVLRTWTARQLANCEDADPINQASALELGGYMSNTLLRDTDVMSMAHSLEVRVPLIDHLLVERMMRIPGDLKLKTSEPKWMLVAAAGDLPREVVDRPKRGFELPFKHWIAGPLRDQVSASFSSTKLDEIFNRKALESVWDDFLHERVSWSRAWSIFALDSWCRTNL